MVEARLDFLKLQVKLMQDDVERASSERFGRNEPKDSKATKFDLKQDSSCFCISYKALE